MTPEVEVVVVRVSREVPNNAPAHVAVRLESDEAHLVLRLFDAPGSEAEKLAVAIGQFGKKFILRFEEVK